MHAFLITQRSHVKSQVYSEETIVYHLPIVFRNVKNYAYTKSKEIKVNTCYRCLVLMSAWLKEKGRWRINISAVFHAV